LRRFTFDEITVCVNRKVGRKTRFFAAVNRFFTARDQRIKTILMYVVTATFEREIAIGKTGELLAMANEPDRLAEKLDLVRNVEKVKQGIAVSSFKRVIEDVEKLAEFVVLDHERKEVREGKWAFNFLGQGMTTRKLAKISGKIRNLGSLIEAPRWFYKQDRVWLLGAIRDYALVSSAHDDGEWFDIDARPINLPLVEMFEKGDFDHAKTVADQLEKPLADLDPKFVLQQMEGHRALLFNFEKNSVVYNSIVRGHPTTE
jgi:hypothetical protein